MRRFVILGALAALLTLAVTPVAATPPEEFDDPGFFVLFPDVNVEKSVFINITAEDFCEFIAAEDAWFAAFAEYEAWLDAGMPDPWKDGDPPGEPGPPPMPNTKEDVTIKFKNVGGDRGIGKVDQVLYIEMWEFDDGVLPDNLVGPCEDIAGQAGPWATGEVRFQGHHNGAFGEKVRGVVSAADGDYSYRNTFHVNGNCRFDEATFTPACLVDNSTLRRLK